MHHLVQGLDNLVGFLPGASASRVIGTLRGVGGGGVGGLNAHIEDLA